VPWWWNERSEAGGRREVVCAQASMAAGIERAWAAVWEAAVVGRQSETKGRQWTPEWACKSGPARVGPPGELCVGVGVWKRESINSESRLV
jgi:hypothetical protein